MRALLLLGAVLCLSAPLAARDSLGVFGEWGAFRDPEAPRCYAIATARRSASATASIASWPRQQVRAQLHLRLSRAAAKGASLTLNVGGTRFALTGNGQDAWAADAAADAAIVAAMRAASSMQVSGRDTRGRGFTDRYDLTGAATAIDAALVGCAGR